MIEVLCGLDRLDKLQLPLMKLRARECTAVVVREVQDEKDVLKIAAVANGIYFLGRTPETPMRDTDFMRYKVGMADDGWHHDGIGYGVNTHWTTAGSVRGEFAHADHLLPASYKDWDTVPIQFDDISQARVTMYDEVILGIGDVAVFHGGWDNVEAEHAKPTLHCFTSVELPRESRLVRYAQASH
jgi:hypothetical protein